MKELIKYHRNLWFVLALFLILGGTYSVVNPLFESPDEVWHYEYVRWLVEGHGLPTPDAVGSAPWHQEGSQPPLYYQVSALLTAFVSTENAADVIRYNPHATMGAPQADANQNIILHGNADAFPWRGIALAAHLTRLFSLLLGAITVISTYATAWIIFRRKNVATLAAVFVAFNPQFLFLSAAVNNDNLVTTLSALTLWLSVHAIAANKLRKRDAVLFGILAGGAILSKLSGLLVPVLVAGTIFMIAWRQKSWRVFLQSGFIAAGFALLVGGWWYLRNYFLYGDPLGLSAMFNILPQRVHPPNLAELLLEWKGVWRSYWAVFGWFNIPIPERVYQFYAGVSLIGFIGFGVRKWRESKEKAKNQWQRLPQEMLLLGWMAVVFAALIYWAQMRYPQGRLLFPAISAIATVFAAGWLSLLPKAWAKYGINVLIILLISLAALAPFLWLSPTYAAPKTVSKTNIEHPLDITFGDCAHLAGYAINDSAVENEQAINVTLYWQSTCEISADYSVFVHLVDDLGIIQAQQDSLPAGGQFSLRDLSVGDIIPDLHRIELPPTIPLPLNLDVVVGVYDAATGVRLSTPQGDAVSLDAVFVDGEANRPLPINTQFDDGFALEAFQMSPRALHPGDTLGLKLWWMVNAVPSRDYVVFVHVFIPEGAIPGAQIDTMPQSGARPTSTWQAGETIEDNYALTIRDDAPPGLYTVQLGLYDPATFERVTIGYRKDYLNLGQIRVE